jgi:hypothetical protein
MILRSLQETRVDTAASVIISTQPNADLARFVILDRSMLGNVRELYGLDGMHIIDYK